MQPQRGQRYLSPQKVPEDELSNLPWMSLGASPWP